MYETVTVDEALKRGRRMVNLPITFIMLGIMLLLGYFSIQFNMPGYFWLIGVLSIFVIPWLYWSVMITRWRIWAFENVRNVHELKKRAVKEKLIWKDGSFFEKTEIRTASDRQKLDALQLKFDQPDLFMEDYSVPMETEIYFSKKNSIGEIIVGIVMICGGPYFFIASDVPRYLGWVLIIFGIIALFSGVKKYNNKKAQIIISSKGIQTAEIPFHSWDEIANEDVILVRTGKSAQHYFVYDNPSGAKRLNISELDISKNKLEHLLILYRGRHNKSMAEGSN